MNIIGRFYDYFMILVFKMRLWCAMRCFMSAAELQQQRHGKTQICHFTIVLSFGCFTMNISCWLKEKVKGTDHERLYLISLDETFIWMRRVFGKNT